MTVPDAAHLRKDVEAGFAIGPVMLVVDTRVEGCDVPPHLRGAPNLKLNFSPKYASPADLATTETCIQQTLSFNGQDYFVVIPWKAVLAFTTQAGQLGIQLDNFPPELMREVVKLVFKPLPFDSAPPPAPKKPSPLRLV